MARWKTIYDEITSPRPPARRWPLLAAACLPPALLLAAFRLFCRDRAAANAVVWGVTTPVKHAIARLCSRLPFNAAEIFWTLGVLGAAALVGSSLFLVLRDLMGRLRGENTHPLRRLGLRLLAILAAALWVYGGYTVMWGVNYYADTFSLRSGLEGRQTTAEELSVLMNAFAGVCNDLSDDVPRNEAGQYRGDRKALFSRAAGQYATLYDRFPCLELDETAPRPMFYSKIMSILGFTGFYFPFTGESLVNVDAPYCLVPATILHELAHQRNVAPEDEANFLAVAVGLSSQDPEFRYSAALLGYIHLSNALYSADRARWKAADAALNELVRADLRENNAFWARHESPANHAAEAVYSSFARSYEQEDIMKSYGACVDLIAAWYLPPAEE